MFGVHNMRDEEDVHFRWAIFLTYLLVLFVLKLEPEAERRKSVRDE